MEIEISCEIFLGLRKTYLLVAARSGSKLYRLYNAKYKRLMAVFHGPEHPNTSAASARVGSIIP
jgi:hypothetical protein